MSAEHDVSLPSSLLPVFEQGREEERGSSQPTRQQRGSTNLLPSLNNRGRGGGTTTTTRTHPTSSVVNMDGFDEVTDHGGSYHTAVAKPAATTSTPKRISVTLPMTAPQSSSPSPPPPPPPPVPQSPTVDDTLEQAVLRLSQIIKNKEHPTQLLDDTVDTKALLNEIRTAFMSSRNNGVSDTSSGNNTEQFDSSFQRTPSPSASPPPPPPPPPPLPQQQQQQRPSPYQVWRAKAPQSPATPAVVLMRDTQFDHLVDRLYKYLERHEITVAEAQKEIIANELSQLTFTPTINRKSRTLAGQYSGDLMERSLRMKEQHEQKVTAERQRLAEKELQEATFKPHINAKSRNVPSRLMEPHGVATAIVAAKIMAERKAADSATLTFSPKLNPNSMSMSVGSRIFSSSPNKGKAAGGAPGPAVPDNHTPTFQPNINKHSKKLVANRRDASHVHERLYGLALDTQTHHRHHALDGTKSPPPAVVEKRQAQKLHGHVVQYKPEYEFVVRSVVAALEHQQHHNGDT